MLHGAVQRPDDNDDRGSHTATKRTRFVPEGGGSTTFSFGRAGHPANLRP